MVTSGQQGEKLLTRDEYYDGVANNMGRGVVRVRLLNLNK